MKWLYLAVGVFCYVHILRDYLQIEGVRDFFTTFGHFWKRPQYEVPGMIIFFVLGTLALYFSWRLSRV